MTAQDFINQVFEEIEQQPVGIDDYLGPMSQRDSVERVVINGLASYHFGVKIPQDRWPHFTTMRDVINFIGNDRFDG